MCTLHLIAMCQITAMVNLLQTFTHANDFGDHYRKVNTSMLQTVFLTKTAVSNIACCALCSYDLECESVNYKPSTTECQLSSVPYVHLTNDIVQSATWNVYSKTSEWVLAFRGTPGSGVDVYAAWVDGTSTTTDDITCKKLYTTNCNKHYRSHIVDFWSNLSIAKVKYSLYRDDSEVAFVTFNGTGSNITSWFSQDNVLESSWLDVDTVPCNIFSIVGEDPGRRFYISREYARCPDDDGYTVTVVSDALPCPYDTQLSYPQFLYANSTSYTVIETEFVYADLMAIHVMN